MKIAQKRETRLQTSFCNFVINVQFEIFKMANKMAP